MKALEEEKLETVTGGEKELADMVDYTIDQGKKVFEVLKDMAKDAADSIKKI